MSDHDKLHSTKIQDKLERNVFWLFVATAFTVAIGGIVEIVPLFYLPNTMTQNLPQIVEKKLTIVYRPSADPVHPTAEEVKGWKSLDAWNPGDGVRPYKPLELAGRDVFIHNGCYLCHSQMIRPFRDEKDRYGHYSVSAESMYDHPFQWGSKRTGPDLARVGAKYSDEWHRRHLKYPRDVVPESIMPNFFFLEKKMVDPVRVVDTMKVMRRMPFYPAPYTEEDINGAAEAVKDKTEMDAVVAYLQVLGTMIKFQEGVNYRDADNVGD